MRPKPPSRFPGLGVGLVLGLGFGLVLGGGLGLALGSQADTTRPAACGPEPPLCLAALLDEVDGRGWNGFEWIHKSTYLGELIVSYVHADSPAAAAGLRVGDRVVGIDGVPFEKTSYAQTQAAIDARFRRLAPGRTAILSVQRNRETLEIPLEPVPYGGRQKALHLGSRLLTLYPDLLR